MSDTPPDYEGLDNKTVFERGLADFYSVHIAVVYTPEVVLPSFLMTPGWKDRKDVVHLEYGLDMAVPITDIAITDDGVAATLSFSREPCKTFIPWKAVVGFQCEGLRPPAPKPKTSLKSVP